MCSSDLYAKPHAAYQSTDLREVLEDALRINITSFDRHGVEIVREYQDIPKIQADKHLVMQILVNLVGNARNAVRESNSVNRKVTVRLENELKDEKSFVRVVVEDNGMGITTENLTKIFTFGFTTRKNGHGFGLHTAANAASQMGGTLKAESEGPGRGARFILSLPVECPALAAA